MNKQALTKTRLTLQTGLLLIFLAALSATVCAKEIYKWVDENGNVHYSQDPQHKSAQQMNIKVPQSSAAEETPAPDTGGEKTKQDDGENKPEDAAKKESSQDTAVQQQEAKEKNCQIAMKRLATITAGGRLYEVNEQGERTYWDDGTRQAKLAEAQAHVEKWCSGQE